MADGKRYLMSICTYKSGDFEVMFIDKVTREEITLSGNQQLDSKEREFVLKFAPALVWTEFERITPGE